MMECTTKGCEKPRFSMTHCRDHMVVYRYKTESLEDLETKHRKLIENGTQYKQDSISKEFKFGSLKDRST